MFYKKQKISELDVGDEVNDIFIVKFKKGVRSYSKGYFFKLTLSDLSGNIDFVLWGDEDKEKLKKVYDEINKDDVVFVIGEVTLNEKGRKQISCRNLTDIKVLSSGDYKESDFIKPARKNLDLMFSTILQKINEVKNDEIKKLLYSVFNDESIISKFKEKPGGIEIHHNWVGGLMQHTLEVLDYVLLSYKHFPELNKDLLIAGALLHDIGKIEEMKITTRIKGTNEGQLLGHIILGSILVSKKCDELHISDEIKNKILHIIASHHGKLDYGSPKEPMFPEAIAIYHADELSSKVAEFVEFRENAKNETEDETMYYKRAKRNIFLR